ncbi:MAG: class I SAM-dependent methyltransferase [Spirochaetaceae bacterium]|jgi:23S rRNA G2069 N7-methylase RlmK/C1962 C5-methylase RlmI|nr:class I SAM-dependent methyltransferase [Spirochaetaceae bacterium]
MEKTEAQARMLENRIRKRFKHLKKWAKRIGTDAFRLYDRDIPEIPLIADYYDAYVSAAFYEGPCEKDEAEEQPRLQAMTQALAAGLDIPESQVFLKKRKRQRGKNQYQKLNNQGVLRQVHEKGLTFQVNLSDYLDTGLFLDRRNLRDQIRREARGKRVLNLFAYTCSFSVCAAAGGAAEVDSVDLSNTYLAWGQRNFELNAFTAGPRAPAKYRFIAAEGETFLRRGIQDRRKWDLIILDPPSFSNSKKMRGTLDIRRDHPRLIAQSLGVLADAGVLWFSVNAKGFRLNPADFPELGIQEVHIIDEDFKKKTIPKCYALTRKP